MHTKGPWKANDYGDHIIVAESDWVAIPHKFGDANITRANAALIAAAPELLEALEHMYRVCNMSPDSAPHRVKARLAIAKAKGELK